MNEIQEIKDKVNEIHTALCGNDEYGQEGLKHQVKKNTKHREKWTRFFWVIQGAWLILAVFSHWIAQKFGF